MGIGGGIITKKLLFAVLLISSLSLSGIAGVCASDVGTAQTNTDNNSIVKEKANIQINNTYNVNKSVKTQNSSDECIKTVENKCTSTASIKTNQTAQNINVTSSECSNSRNSASKETNTQNSVSNADSNNQNSVITSPNTVKDTNNTQKQEAAAGEVKTASADQTVNSTSFTVDQIKDAAARVKAYIETNHRLPNYVTIGTTQIQMPDFLKLLTAGLLQINSGTTTPITLKNVNTPTKPTESIKSGSITKAGYLDLAKRVNSFIDANGVLPNYATINLGKLNYNSMIYMFSKILNFQKTNNRLPSYVTVAPWSTISQSTASTVVPAELQKYLAATANCQVTNAQIKALASKITSGKTTTYAKAVAIFNWVRDNIGYSFYYNTKKGAIGTLSAKTANCCDTAHLLIALSRAVGIPAKYVHVSARFTSGNIYGHVYANVWVDGKWYSADATSSRNTFGVINNWNLATCTLKGIYASLPF